MDMSGKSINSGHGHFVTMRRRWPSRFYTWVIPSMFSDGKNTFRSTKQM